jgi:hypothetical protein
MLRPGCIGPPSSLQCIAVKAIEVYADTSVYGGVHDEEYGLASSRFFDQVRTGRFLLVVSDVVRREIEQAPPIVRATFDDLIAFMKLVAVDEQVLRLRDAYLKAGIVSPKWADDAAHVAAATVSEADLIVSWNFKHIVQFERIRLYNAVNALNGFRSIEIRSPPEVIDEVDPEEV